MTDRITNRDLEVVIDLINRAAGTPITGYSEKDGHYKSNPGHYKIGGAYGMVRLEQIMNDGGGIRTITGYGTKREIYNQAHAFLNGIAAAPHPQDESES